MAMGNNRYDTVGNNCPFQRGAVGGACKQIIRGVVFSLVVKPIANPKVMKSVVIDIPKPLHKATIVVCYLTSE
jgi:hypothetical protein